MRRGARSAGPSPFFVRQPERPGRNRLQLGEGRAMKLRAIAAAGVVLLLAACGSGAKGPNNEQLASQVLDKLGAKSTTLVCWTQDGYLAGAFHHSYNRTCGPNQGSSSIYIALDTKKGTWCVITPRYAKLPLCPGFG